MIVKQTQLKKRGTIFPNGLSSKKSILSLVVELILAGELSVVKSAITLYKEIVGNLSFSGNTIKKSNISLDAILSFSGRIVKLLAHIVSSELVFVGAALKNLAFSLQGNLTMASITNSITNFVLIIQGDLSLSGLFNRVTNKNITATILPSGNMFKNLFLTFEAGIDIISSIVTSVIEATRLGTVFLLDALYHRIVMSVSLVDSIFSTVEEYGSILNDSVAKNTVLLSD